jgi:hypothetical protein
MAKLMRSALNEKERQHYELAIVQVASMLQASENLVPMALDPAVADSPIGRANRRQLREPYELSRLLLYSVEDHLRTVLALLETQTLPTFALYSLLRPAAEAAVRMAYLLEAGIDETQRLARGLNVRLENLIQQNKVVADHAMLTERLANLERRATANGIDTLRDRRDRVDGFGEREPQETDLFAEYLGEGELIYRYLSGHIHSMAWVQISREGAVPTDEPGVSSMPMVLNVEVFANVLTIVLGRHEKNVVRLLQSGGYPREVWVQAMTTAVAAARARVAAMNRGDPAPEDPPNSGGPR